jgi:hypothetical protein
MVASGGLLRDGEVYESGRGRRNQIRQMGVTIA